MVPIKRLFGLRLSRALISEPRARGCHMPVQVPRCVPNPRGFGSWAAALGGASVIPPPRQEHQEAALGSSCTGYPQQEEAELRVPPRPGVKQPEKSPPQNLGGVPRQPRCCTSQAPCSFSLLFFSLGYCILSCPRAHGELEGTAGGQEGSPQAASHSGHQELQWGRGKRAWGYGSGTAPQHLSQGRAPTATAHVGCGDGKVMGAVGGCRCGALGWDGQQ